MLLRVKENEIEYLHKEISCLRNEIQSLTRVTSDCVFVKAGMCQESIIRCCIFSVLIICRRSRIWASVIRPCMWSCVDWRDSVRERAALLKNTSDWPKPLWRRNSSTNWDLKLFRHEQAFTAFICLEHGRARCPFLLMSLWMVLDANLFTEGEYWGTFHAGSATRK